ncbi:MAG: HutD family protein [Pseudomonadota bacterium]
MSRIGLLPASARLSQPWKNGGGSTLEIAVYPPEAGLADFDWRISMASVATPGRFSHFEDVDRILTVIEGQLELCFNHGAETVELDASSPPHVFPGDREVFGRPLAGSVVDLNLMLRRSRWSGTVERIAPSGSIALSSNCTIMLFLGGGHVRWRSEALSLQPFDAIHIDGAIGEVIAWEGDDDIFVVNLFHATA